MSRAILVKWLKLTANEDQQASRMKLFFLSFFLSTSLSGVLAATILLKMNIWLVVITEVVLILIGALILLPMLMPKPNHAVHSEHESPKSYLHSLQIIFRQPLVRACFILVIVSQAVFQSAYSVLVSVLPIKQLNLGVLGIGLFQVAASVGIIAGFLLCWFFVGAMKEKHSRFPMRSILLAVIAFASLLLATYVKELIIVLIFFGMLNFAYECIWLHNSSAFFSKLPVVHMARYQFILYSISSFMMGLMTYLYAVLISSTNVIEGTLIYVLISVILILGFLLPSFKRDTDIAIA